MAKSIKIASWNVNGIRACYKKGLLDWLNNESPHICCFQETKSSENQVPQPILEHPNYYNVYASAEKKGYSGVGILSSKKLPLPNVTYGLDEEKFDCEGRTLIAEYDSFILITCYFPNGQRDHGRVPYKMEYCKLVEKKSAELQKKSKKPVIITGDYNTAHKEIDLKNPKANINTTGFLPIERKWIDDFIEKGYIDIFRESHPEEEGHYTWWTYRSNCRQRNIGWRIDYFFITEKIRPWVKKCYHQPETMGSDHCPIFLELKVP
ncbi:MAG: exodeoxyribonuclease III [Bdellovibrionota bacterium]|nr:exodeoxyribonuclease III [Bdellovibrionota bacterium]